MQKSWPLPFTIAHRGASQLAPENTLAALKLAKQQGATWVESDIQLTQDRHPVIFHDTTLNRTTNGKGKLSDITLSKLSLLDAGSWFSVKFKNERVPTLQEWLRCAADLTVGLNLEVKCSTKKEAILLAECIIDHLQKYWLAHANTIFISSSSQFALMQISERANSLPLGLICEKKITEKEAVALLRSNIISIHQPYKILDEKYVALLHAAGLHVLAYTVNTSQGVEKLKSINVDGIFTDAVSCYPCAK
ncbi:MAG: hypothetical protein A3C44_01290 [Gammaproteobacteria bacterium RIFCSPHIGHO2_02_FULL_39_13]|nr:MAG: hypothetical protein A3C44_01290 [Gammaproteobacteria bacterium RIFCSPHIGHO2_02_FULL_39_13]OGT49528.1 MAG: hypothetical protein A3E53_00035 [Gammaproteobacteria bacterium RIFCSPHIGHO2_12_FULL_39_24]